MLLFCVLNWRNCFVFTVLSIKFFFFFYCAVSYWKRSSFIWTVQGGGGGASSSKFILSLFLSYCGSVVCVCVQHICTYLHRFADAAVIVLLTSWYHRAKQDIERIRKRMWAAVWVVSYVYFVQTLHLTSAGLKWKSLFHLFTYLFKN